MNHSPNFHLSVVVGSRNDDHGGKLLYRMQHFISGLIEQCKRHDLSAEIIIVEWNPPEDKLSLESLLEIPEELSPCDVRIIQVPQKVHSALKHADKIPLFQMIAKNVGIRRARGKFVLSTNIDILFSDEMMVFLRDKLKPGYLYRANRYDVPTELPITDSFDTILNFCKTHAFRVHGKYGSKVRINKKWMYAKQEKSHKKRLLPFVLGLFKIFKFPQRAYQLIKFFSFHSFECRAFVRNFFVNKNIKKILFTFIFGIVSLGYHLTCLMFLAMIKGFRVIQFWINFLITCCLRLSFRLSTLINHYLFEKGKGFYVSKPHTNGCGDFTLMAYEDWETLKGYPEWPIFSWHIDSVLVYQALFNGIQIKTCSKHQCIYHIEHGKGSGYTPESATILFNRLKEQRVPYLNNAKLKVLIDRMRKQSLQDKTIVYNKDDWGFISAHLHESTDLS